VATRERVSGRAHFVGDRIVLHASSFGRSSSGVHVGGSKPLSRQTSSIRGRINAFAVR
jgi:hypothetical protein